MTKEIAWSYAPIYRAGRAVGHLPVARARELSPSHRARLYRAVKRGEAVPLRPGVFAPTAAWQNLNAEDRHRARVAEAVAALSFPLVVSHESAAVIHGIPLLGGIADIVHVTRPRRGGSHHSAHLMEHPTRSAAELDVVSVAGMQLTSPARTVADLARTGTFARGLIAADHALRENLASRTALQHQADVLAHLPGASRSRLVAHHADPDAESPGESLCRARFLLLHAPMPTLQAPVFINGRHYRLDFLWEEPGIVGEFDGALKYGGTAQDSSEAVYQEKLREDDLRTRFNTVVRFTWNDALRVDALERELRRVGVLTGPPVRDSRFL